MNLADPDLSVHLGKIFLSNPVMTASGTFGYGEEYASFLDLNQLGAIVVKGLSLLPHKGNPPPRIIETVGGMLNAIGLENIGVETFLKEKMPFLRKLKTPVIVNIWGTTVDEYVRVAERFDPIPDIAGIEINISCPNIKSGGMAFGTNPQTAYDVAKAVRNKFSRLVMVKLSPNVTDIAEIARSVEQAGADVISLINTISGMAVDIETRASKLANIIGGLSGPAIKPVALRMVWQVAQAVKVPVVGIGGIMTAEDALEFIIAGASAIQVGTANFVNPAICAEIIQGIKRYLVHHHVASVQELIGSLKIN